MTSIIKLLYFSLTTSVLCQSISINKRIYGGIDKKSSQHHASLWVYNNETKQFTVRCGASILTNLWLITSSLCVYDEELVSVIPGYHYPSGQIAFERISQIFRAYYPVDWKKPDERPLFDPKKSNEISKSKSNKKSPHKHDLALLRVIEPIRFSNYSQSIKMFYEINNDTLEDLYSFAIVAGYGQTENDMKNKRFIMKEANAYIRAPKFCEKKFKKEGKEFDSKLQICTTWYKREGICSLDLGNGLTVIDEFSNKVLVGVSSFMFHQLCVDSVDSTTVFTRISAYYKWIRYILEKYSRDPSFYYENMYQFSFRSDFDKRCLLWGPLCPPGIIHKNDTSPSPLLL